jgi:hypothetical protein
MSVAAGKMLAAVQAIGYVGVLQEGVGAVALRCRRPVPGGMWAVMVWQGEALVFCWVVTSAGFVEKGAASILPYLEGEAAAAEYARKRAEATAKAAVTRAETEALRLALMPRVMEMLALEDPVPMGWMTGGLVGETKKLRKLIAKGEADRDAGRADARDRAGG